jgi:hypothetical protein
VHSLNRKGWCHEEGIGPLQTNERIFEKTLSVATNVSIHFFFTRINKCVGCSAPDSTRLPAKQRPDILDYIQRAARWRWQCRRNRCHIISGDVSQSRRLLHPKAAPASARLPAKPRPDILDYSQRGSCWRRKYRRNRSRIIQGILLRQFLGPQHVEDVKGYRRRSRSRYC